MNEPNVKPRGMPLAKRAQLYLTLLPVAFALGLGIGYLLWGSNVEPPPTAAQAAITSAATPQEVKRYDVPVDDDPAIGPENAKITIVEFSDFECPYCTKWHDEVWPRIQETYPEDVRLVYRDFPLYTIHGNAIFAAEAANCAGEQDAYWEYHDKLFSEQYGLGDEAYKKYADELELDRKAFDECLTSRRYKEEVQADYDYAANLGVSSTPTFFINGVPVVGAQPFEVFNEVIQLELAGKLPK